MEKLPTELLERVLMYLPPLDRMESALTCRHWAKTVSSSSLLEDVWLKLPKYNSNSLNAALIGSERLYSNLRISKDNLLRYSSEFRTKIGRNLRNLELLDCFGYCGDLFGILREFGKLEYLKISSRPQWLCPGPDVFIEGIPLSYFKPPGETCAEATRGSLRTVRHLHLDFVLRADVFAHLLSIMPNVKSVSLSDFETRNDLLKLIPSLLGPERVITELDLASPHMKEEDLIQLVRAFSESLTKFHYEREYFTLELYETVCGCTKLRHLSLPKPDFHFDDDHLEKLLLNVVDLESLELSCCQGLTAESLIPIREQKKLRKLGLVNCNGLRTTDLLNGLGEISKLQSLDLRGTAIDVRILQGLARLPNLHELSVYCTLLPSEGLGVIPENIINCDDADGIKIRRFENLKSLSIEKDSGLTNLIFENWMRSPALESLQLRKCSLTDAGLARIVAHHNCLKTFALDDCPNVTGAGFVTLLRSEPRLENLYVRECHGLITKDVIVTLRNFCPRLRDFPLDVAVVNNRRVSFDLCQFFHPF